MFINTKLYTFFLKSLKNDLFFKSSKQENLFYIKDLNHYYPIYTQPNANMNSINVFNKQLIELQATFIQEFIDKLKVNLPEDYHSIMDEQLKTDKEQIKDNIKNINKKIKKINNQDAPKKPAKANCWRLFCTEKSKELTDVPQNEKWAMCSKLWEEVKTNGGDKYWKDLADQLNSELADSTPVSDEDTKKTAPKKAASKKTAPKKAAPKKAAPKKAAPIIQDIPMDSEDDNDGYATRSDDEPDDDFIFVNEQQQDNRNNMVPQITV